MEEELARRRERDAKLDAREADHALRVAETAALECPGVSLLFGRASLGEEPLLRFERGFADLETRRPVQKDTIFRIFSMTKPIVSASILPLIESGKVRLLDPISKWLPEFDNSNLSVWRDGRSVPLGLEAPRITVLNVLRHTAGMFYPSNPANGTPGVEDPELCAKFLESGVRAASSPREFAQRLATVPLCHEPGERFTYSVATALVACIAEAVTGLPYEDYLDSVLLSPLGMRDTGFFLRDDGQRERLANLYVEQPEGSAERFLEAPRKIFTYERGSPVNADGGLFSTIEDYARFIRFLLSDGLGIIDRSLLRTFVQDSLRRTGLALPEDFLGFPASFSLGAYVHPTAGKVCGWSGLANTHFWFDAHEGRYAILMAQKFPFSWRYQQLLTDRIRRGIGSSSHSRA